MSNVETPVEETKVKINIDEIIEYLQGSCKSLDEAVDTFYPGLDSMDLEDEHYEAIDNALFLCEECGWWCEVGDYAMDQDMEIVGENICGDCGEN